MITKYPQWKHQARAYDFVLNRPKGAMLAIPMAGGKTKVPIDLIQNSDVRKVLIAAPLAVIPAWDSEFEKHTVDPLDYPVIPLDTGTIAERTAAAESIRRDYRKMKNVNPIYVINYQAIWREPFRSWALGQM